MSKLVTNHSLHGISLPRGQRGDNRMRGATVNNKCAVYLYDQLSSSRMYNIDSFQNNNYNCQAGNICLQINLINTTRIMSVAIWMNTKYTLINGISKEELIVTSLKDQQKIKCSDKIYINSSNIIPMRYVNCEREIHTNVLIIEFKLEYPTDNYIEINEIAVFSEFKIGVQNISTEKIISNVAKVLKMKSNTTLQYIIYFVTAIILLVIIVYVMRYKRDDTNKEICNNVNLLTKTISFTI